MAATSAGVLSSSPDLVPSSDWGELESHRAGRAGYWTRAERVLDLTSLQSDGEENEQQPSKTSSSLRLEPYEDPVNLDLSSTRDASPSPTPPRRLSQTSPGAGTPVPVTLSILTSDLEDDNDDDDLPSHIDFTKKAAPVAPSPSSPQLPSPIIRRDRPPASPTPSNSSSSSMSSSSSRDSPPPQQPPSSGPPHLSPSPPPQGRAMRKRTAAQLKPYSIESSLYTKSLLKNGWKGAVVANPAFRTAEAPPPGVARKEKKWDDLGGWLDVQKEDGVAVRVASDDDGSASHDSEESDVSLDGEELLEREARKVRRELDGGKKRKRRNESDGVTRVRRAASQEGSREVGRVKQKEGGGAAKRSKDQHRHSDFQSGAYDQLDNDEEDGEGADFSHRRNAVAGSSTERKRKAQTMDGNSTFRNPTHQRAPASSKRSATTKSSASTPANGDRLPSAKTSRSSRPSTHKSSNAAPVPRKRQRSHEPRHQPDFGLGQERGSLSRAGALAMVANAFGSARPAKDHLGRRRPNTGMADLDRALLEEIVALDEDSEDDEVIVLSGDSGDEEAEGEGDDGDGWSQSDLRELPKLKTKLTKKQTRMLRRMLTPAQFREAMEDLAKMEAERRGGQWSDGSEHGSGDERFLPPSRRRKHDFDSVAPASEKQPKRKKRKKTAPRVIELDDDEALFDFAVVNSLDQDESGDDDNLELGRSSRVEPRRPLVARELNAKPAHSAQTVPAPTRPPDHWASFSRFSPDFSLHLLPSGVHFPPSSFVRLGYLNGLLDPSSVGSTLSLSKACLVFDIALTFDMSVEDLSAVLPQVSDAVFDIVTIDVEDVKTDSRRLSPVAGEAFRFFGSYITQQLASLPLDRRRTFGISLVRQMERLDEQLDDYESRYPARADAVNRHRITLSWHAVDVNVRLSAIASEENDAARLARVVTTLVARLVHFGALHTMKSLKSLSAANEGEGERFVHDVSVEAWLALISLALSPERTKNAFSEADLWRIVGEQLEASLPPKALTTPVAGEVASYSAMMLCAISQFTSSGVTTAVPRLKAHWNVVGRAIELFKLDALADSSNGGCSSTSLARLDHYLSTLFARCLVLVNRWQWRFQSEDKILNKLYGLLQARHLSNLSIEPSDDWPLFLQHMERFGAVELEADDTVFAIFVKLVVQASEDLTKDPKVDQARVLGRLFTRLSPMTQKPWTKDSVQVKRRLSPLVNHYSLLISFVALLPSSSSQRLDQARRLVDFASIDHDSRTVVVRAMLNFGVVFQRKGLALEPIIEWMSSVAATLMAEYLTLETSERKAKKSVEAMYGTSGSLRGHTVLMVMVIRTAEYLLKLTAEGERALYPNAVLLHSTWTSQILSSPFAHNRTLRDQVVVLVQVFLDLRLKGLPNRVLGEEARDSQDEYNLLDMDMDDPGLNAFLQEVEGGSEVSTVKSPRELDALFAQDWLMSVTPLLLQLISTALNSENSLGESGSTRLEGAYPIMACWSRALCILSEHSLVELATYLQYGKNSWRYISDPLGRRQTGLFLAVHVLQSRPDILPVFSDDFLDIWFQSAAARHISLQDRLTSFVLSAPSLAPLFDGHPFLKNDSVTVTRTTFKDLRISLLSVVFRNIAKLLAAPLSNSPLFQPDRRWTRQFFHGLLRPLVASMHDNLASIGNDSSRAKYVTFVRAVLSEMKACEVVANEQSLATLRPLKELVAKV